MSKMGSTLKIIIYIVAIVTVIMLGGVYGGRMIGILILMLGIATLIIGLDVRRMRSSQNISILKAIDTAIIDLFKIWFKGSPNEKSTSKNSKRKSKK